MKTIIDAQDISVEIKIFEGATQLFAQAEVTFFGTLITRGWRVMKSNHLDAFTQEYLWIQPPSYKTKFGGYNDIVVIDDEKTFRTVQESIYNAYFQKRNLFRHQSENMKTEIQVQSVEAINRKEVADEIPF